MSRIRPFGESSPKLGDEVFVADTARVIGDVVVGDRSSLWFGVVARGDVFHIRIGDDTNIQDHSVLHVTSGQHPTLIGNRVTVGHRALLHGCTIADESLVGMGAIVMDEAVVGAHCIIGAGALVTPGMVIPEGHLALGSPAKVVRRLRGGEIEHIKRSAEHYVSLAQAYIAAGD
ncbi:MAG: gamma carbonic anhydrase family protein [Deltaproteobacteria bacterium]|nr:gamma carbonic anhydrase family protein [Deltaproteobacteria bacterium]